MEKPNPEIKEGFKQLYKDLAENVRLVLLFVCLFFNFFFIKNKKNIPANQLSVHYLMKFNQKCLKLLMRLF